MCHYDTSILKHSNENIWQQKIDVREETPEETAMRIFEMLRIFKYNPADEDQWVVMLRLLSSSSHWSSS